MVSFLLKIGIFENRTVVAQVEHFKYPKNVNELHTFKDDLGKCPKTHYKSFETIWQLTPYVKSQNI